MTIDSRENEEIWNYIVCQREMPFIIDWSKYVTVTKLSSNIIQVVIIKHMDLKEL